MAKGVLYCMTTAITGLIKIGKTQTNRFEERMRFLESNGYHNTTGLKRHYAIEVDEYDEKETMLHNILERSRVADSELFAIDVNLVESLMSSLEGKQIYPATTSQTKAQVFSAASESVVSSKLPDGTYYLKRRVKDFGNKEVHAQMEIKNGVLTVLAGSDFCSVTVDRLPDTLKERRKKAKVKNNKLIKDEVFKSASYAGMFVLGNYTNGLTRWKDSNGVTLKELMDSGNDD